MVLCVLFISSSVFCNLGFGNPEPNHVTYITIYDGCTDPTAFNYDPSAEFDDGSCIPVIVGCMDETACNFMPEANTDEICDYFSCLAIGCTNSGACNYDPAADFNDGSCEYAVSGYNCDGSCSFDLDGDGICDSDEVLGCATSTACNYNELATDDDGSCVYPIENYDCNGNCTFDENNNGVCDSDEISGCMDSAACNYNPLATEEDGSCSTIDECGICGGGGIPEGDCDCNGNQLDALGICGGICLEDLNLDGVCDVDVVWGCGDDTAINFNPLATDDDGNCNYDTFGPETFTYTPTPISGTLYGTINVDGVMATGLDWIAAFDEDGNCAGANSVLMNEGVAYANLTIYGDDLTTDIVDEGMNTGENFELVFYDASEDVFITYSDDLGSEYLSGWENTYGAPIPAWNNPLTIFDFTSPLPCPGDFNENGQLDQSDLLIFLSAFGTPCTGCIQDINNNEFVDLADLLIFLASFGNPCP